MFTRRKRWSVTRFKTHENGRSYGPAGRFRFADWFLAWLLYRAFCIEALWTGHRPWLCYIPKFSVDKELGLDYRDVGPWRSYRLTASGDSVKELILDATIEAIDQDGGTLDTYGMDDAPTDVYLRSLNLILGKVWNINKGV